MPGTDYSQLAPPPLRTRSSTDSCHCHLCNKGRQTLVTFEASKSKAKDPPLKVCTECQGEVAPGVSHVCTRGERNNNILELFRSVSDRSRGQILSASLKGKYSILQFNTTTTYTNTNSPPTYTYTPTCPPPTAIPTPPPPQCIS